MATTALERRLQHRSVHRSRSTAVSIALIVLVLVAAWIGTESVLAAIGAAPLLVAPQTAADAALRPATLGVTIAVASAVVLLVLGIWLVVLAVAPGRQHRRTVARDRAVVVIDDRIVASTAVAAASTAAGLSPDQVDAWAKGRRVGVRIVPTSGIPIDTESVRAAVDDRLRSVDENLVRRVTVDVADKGVLA
ncbi:hypothetical protein [Curtobacterium sp. RRHDQ10]|uniref:hypothetical protein n=1 Tax=Curtobacterium phyllosphaerae TaxID=3413379 RepID=UPI003BF0049A